MARVGEWSWAQAEFMCKSERGNLAAPDSEKSLVRFEKNLITQHSQVNKHWLYWNNLRSLSNSPSSWYSLNFMILQNFEF